jgi:thiol-disulfide isomerase/thioredoxin
MDLISFCKKYVPKYDKLLQEHRNNIVTVKINDLIQNDKLFERYVELDFCNEIFSFAVKKYMEFVTKITLNPVEN